MVLLALKSGTQPDSHSSASGSRPSTRPSCNGPVVLSDLHFGPLAGEIALAAIHQRSLEWRLCYRQELSLLRGNVVNKRRVEFALGRIAAHRALRAAGHTGSAPVLQGVGRTPAWPSGFVGSITHCGPWAVAAAAKADSMKSIGIDLEDAESVPVEEIVQRVCTDAETEWVLAGANGQLKLAALFSAKEAAYKALFPLCRKFFDFHALQLTWSSKSNVFRGVLQKELSADFPVGYPLQIGCQQRANFVFTHVAIAADGRTKPNANLAE